MTWTKREAVSNLAILGEDEGNRKVVGGLLAAIVPDHSYPDKSNYEIVQKSGESLLLSGSASLERQIRTTDVGKFIKATFKGWGKSAKGRFKEIEVLIWEGEPDAVMREWPRFDEFHGPKASEKQVAAVVASVDEEAADLPF